MPRLKDAWIIPIHDPLETGGFGLYRDSDGNYHVEHCETPSDEDIEAEGFNPGRSFTGTEEPDEPKGGASKLRWTVCREQMERFVWFQDPEDAGRRYLLSEMQAKFCAEDPDRSPHEEWWVKSLPGVASSMGITVLDLTTALCDSDPAERLRAYEALIGYHGWPNWDSHPLDLTEEEVRERYGLPDIEELEALREKRRFVTQFSYTVWDRSGATRSYNVVPGALLEWSYPGEERRNVGRVFDRPLYDGVGKRLEGRWVRVLQISDDMHHAYERYVSLDWVNWSRTGPFQVAQWFFSAELPPIENILRAVHYGSLTDSYFHEEANQRILRGLPPRKEGA